MRHPPAYLRTLGAAELATLRSAPWASFVDQNELTMFQA